MRSGEPSVSDRVEARFDRFGHWVYRRAWWVLAVLLPIAFALASQLRHFEIDTSIEGNLTASDPIRVAYERFRDQYGRDERVIIAIEPQEVFDLAFLAELRELHRAIEEEVPLVVEVTSLVNARSTRGEGDELIVEDLMESWPESEADLALLRERVFANPIYRDMLVSADGRTTTVLVETEVYSQLGESDDVLEGFDDAAPNGETPAFLTGEENNEIVAAVLRVVDRHRGPDRDIWVAGTPLLNHALSTSMLTAMQTFTALSVGVIALFLLILFRRGSGVFIPLFVAILALLTTLGATTMIGMNATLIAQIMPTFLLAVGVGGSVHVLTIFYQQLAEGLGREDAIARALGHSGLAVGMTCLTTAAGLGSFLVATVAPVVQMGIMGPLGLLLVFVYTVVLVPALVAVIPQGRRTRGAGTSSRLRGLLTWVGDASTANAGRVVLASVALLGFSAIGITRLGFSHDPVRWFAPDAPIRVSIEAINDRLAGSAYLEAIVDTGVEDGMRDPVNVRRLERMEEAALALHYHGVEARKTVSLANIVREIHQALNENRPEFSAIPDSRELLSQELILFENSGSDDLEDVVSSTFQEGRFTMTLPFIDALPYAAYIERLEAALHEAAGEGVTIRITGAVKILATVFDSMIHTLARSYVIAFAVIAPMLVLVVGRLRIGLLALIPNITPIVVTLGAMGWLGMPLELFTLLIGCIALGLAVDDTIHFMHNFRRYFERSGNVREAVHETLRTTGQAMLVTSLVLTSGFLMFTLGDLSNVRAFGILTATTVMTAFLADIVLAPALLQLVLRGQERAADHRVD